MTTNRGQWLVNDWADLPQTRRLSVYSVLPPTVRLYDYLCLPLPVYAFRGDLNMKLQMEHTKSHAHDN